jgi:hypothetical protein
MKRRLGVGFVAVFALGAAVYLFAWPQLQTVVLDESVPETSFTAGPSVALVDTPSHPASGTVSIYKTGTQTILRYEDFKTLNGPDLRVYVSTDLEASEFVDLGPLKATSGNVNYEIPSDTDLGKYRYALVWCEKFGVLFNYADLSQR